MENVTGEEIVYAWKKNPNDWGGDAVAVGVGDGFYGLPANVDGDVENSLDESLGSFFTVENIPGMVKVQPSVPAYLRYNDKVLLGMFAQFMGIAGVPAAHAGGANSKDHVLKIAKNIDGKNGTLVAKVGTKIIEIPFWKIAKVEIKWDSGKPAVITFSGDGFNEVLDSAINTGATFANVTILERKRRAYSIQTEFRLNVQSGDALDADDKVPWSSITLTAERKLRGEPGTFATVTTDDEDEPRDLIDEPTNDGPWSSSLSVQIPKCDVAGWTDVLKNTSLKGTIVSTGPIIEDAIRYQFGVQMPHLKPKSSKTPHKQGKLVTTKEFDILAAAAAPTGMVGCTDPFWVLLTNLIAVDLQA